MASPTVMFDFLTALLTLAESTTLPAKVRVFDGSPMIPDGGDFLAIGCDPDSSDDTGSTDSGWLTLGRTVGGDFRIPCSIQVHRGDSNPATPRAAAKVILDALWTAILPDGARPNATALGVDGVLSSRMDGITVRTMKFRQDAPQQGTTVVVTFDIVGKSYLSTT